MYGLIHLAFRAFVQERLGNTLWDAIVKQRDLSEDSFISMSPYSDNVTVGMMTSAASLSGLSFDNILEEFGKFWISYMGRGDYAPMMNFAGGDVISFLSNINNIHDAVSGAIAGTRTPRFDVVKVSNKSILIRYASERAGLLPFVTGLIKGIFQRFGVDGKVMPVKIGKNFTEIKVIIEQ